MPRESRTKAPSVTKVMASIQGPAISSASGRPQEIRNSRSQWESRSVKLSMSAVSRLRNGVTGPLIRRPTPCATQNSSGSRVSIASALQARR